MLLGLLHVLRGLRPAGSKAPAGNAAPERLLNGRAALTLVLSAGYAAGMVGHMPYALCTAIYVAVFVALFAAEGRSLGRRLLVGAGMGVATALAVTVVFQHLFLVRLP
jgi:hypothetical protein